MQNKWTSRVLSLVAAVAFLSIGWFGHELLSARLAKPTKAVRETIAPAVAVETVGCEALNPEKEYVGHVEPVQETDILPQIEGYVTKVCFTEGAFVQAGDVLFEIDPEQYEAARRLRHAEVDSALARVGVARAEVDRAERYFTRLKSADGRGVTAVERDTAEMALASAKAALSSAEAAVEQTRAAAEIADFNLKHTVVKAPISGRIGKAFHHVGDFVSPSKSALAHVVQTDPIRVVIPVPDRDYGTWRSVVEHEANGIAPRLRLRLPDGGVYDRTGTVEFGDNRVDRETGTVFLHAGFANESGALLPDMFVHVIRDEVDPPRAPVVPEVAVERTAKGTHVWVLQQDGTVREAAVETGVTWKGRTVVLKGVDEGMKIVVSGGFKLRDGQKVSVTP